MRSIKYKIIKLLRIAPIVLIVTACKYDDDDPGHWDEEVDKEIMVESDSVKWMKNGT